jgi:putative DNA primase/helicase
VGDPNLRERLRHGGDGQREAVLAWLIAGAVRWYQNDRLMPADPRCVQEATQAWRRTSDLLMRYMDDRLVFDDESHVAATDLFVDFNEWLTTYGHRGWSDQSFSARLTQHGEAVANGVEKKRGIRSSKPGLSRRRGGTIGATGVVLPKAYTAWLGLRFRTHDDETESSDDLDE